MPHYKKRYKRTRFRKPLSKAQYKTVAKIANKQIHKMSELKTLDTNHGDQAIIPLGGAPHAAATLEKITMPAQGSGDGTRDGDSLYLRSLSLNGTMKPAATDKTQIIRLILVQFLDTDAGNVPDVSDILADVTTGNALESIHSFYVTDPPRKFKVLDDRIYYWDSNNVIAQKPYRVRIKARDLMIRKPQFTDGLVTGTGQIYLFGMSEVSDGALIQQLQSRWRYFDN